MQRWRQTEQRGMEVVCTYEARQAPRREVVTRSLDPTGWRQIAREDGRTRGGVGHFWVQRRGVL